MEEKKREIADVRLHSISIKTSNLFAMDEFYSNCLGLISATLTAESLGYFISTHNYLNLEGFSIEDKEVSPVIPWFQVKNVVEVYNRCVKSKMEIVTPLKKYPNGSHYAKVKDPDGNIIGISQLGTGPWVLDDMLKTADDN